MNDNIMTQKLLLLLFLGCSHRNPCSTTWAFSSFTTTPRINLRDNIHFPSTTIRYNYLHHSSSTRLNNYKNGNNGNFDMSKPVFDLFTLRTIRNDALLQYNSLNQSEPLRINLYLFLSITLFSFPFLSESIIGSSILDFSTINNNANSIAILFTSILFGMTSSYLFYNECQNRSKQLYRIEKELNAEYLTLKLSTMNKFQESIFGRSGTQEPIQSLKDLRGKKRIVALCGPTSVLKETLVPFRIFRRRLGQSSTIIIPVPTDLNIVNRKSSDTDDVPVQNWNELGISEEEIRSCQWLGQAQNVNQWIQYFTSLNGSKDSQSLSNQQQHLTWFGLNYNGRSFASGNNNTEHPRLIELLGRNLRPVQLLDVTDPVEKIIAIRDNDTISATKEEILSQQNMFYHVLTNGLLEEMNNLWWKEDSPEVTEVLSQGGRIDDWSKCLEDGARPSNMKYSGSDVLLLSDDVAYSTTVEFPAASNLDSYNSASSPSGMTLLAMQRWRRHSKQPKIIGSDDHEDGDDKEYTWKLEYHQTIPWSSDSRAGGTLRCDHRGCVALTRRVERRTFGGLIG